MKIKFLLIFLIIFIFSSCVVIAPPAQPETPVEAPPAAVPPEIITLESIESLQAAATFQPSFGALGCSWTEGGHTFWLQDLFKASLYDAATLDLIAEFDGGEYSAIYDVSPDGKTVAYSLDGQEIRLFDIFIQSDRLTFSPDFPYSGAFFSPDGSLLGVESLDEIKVVQFNTSDCLHSNSLSGFETAAPVYAARYSPDGRSLVWWARGTVQPMEIASGNMGPALGHEDFVVAHAMSPDGSSIATAAAGTLDGEFQPLVTLWDAKTGDMRWQKGNPGYFSSLDFSPDGSLLAAGTEGEVIIFETATGNEMARLKTGTEVVNSLGFSPDGSVLITCETNGKVTLWKPK